MSEQPVETTWVLIVHLCGRNVLIEFHDHFLMYQYTKHLDYLNLHYTYTSVFHILGGDR